MRKVNKIGMIKDHDKNDTLRLVLRCLPAIDMVPSSDVAEIFLILPENIFYTNFHPPSPLGRVAGTAAPGCVGKPHDHQQSQIDLLAPRQHRAKHVRSCSHSTWLLDDLWVAFPWIQSAVLGSPIFAGKLWIPRRTNIAGNSRFGGDVTRHSLLYEFHNCTLCCEVSRLEILVKVPSLLLALDIALFQSFQRLMTIG